MQGSIDAWNRFSSNLKSFAAFMQSSMASLLNRAISCILFVITLKAALFKSSGTPSVDSMGWGNLRVSCMCSFSIYSNFKPVSLPTPVIHRNCFEDLAKRCCVNDIDYLNRGKLRHQQCWTACVPDLAKVSSRIWFVVKSKHRLSTSLHKRSMYCWQRGSDIPLPLQLQRTSCHQPFQLPTEGVRGARRTRKTVSSGSQWTLKV